MDNCIFVALWRTIPANIVFQDEQVLAFDINAQAPVTSW